MKTNIELLAAVHMLGLEQFTATAINYRFKLSNDNRLYVSITKNTFYIYSKFPHLYATQKAIPISDKTIPHILKLIS